MVRGNEQHRDASPKAVRRTRRAALRGLLVVGLLVWSCGPARALMVGTTPNVIPDTSAAPIDNPGFLNAGATGTFLNGVYIGDGWVLSAKHTGISSIKFDHLSTVFQPIKKGFNANPTLQDYQAYVVPNPTGQGLTDTTDLRLTRVKGDAINMVPGLPSLTIASQPLTINLPVTMISYGKTRNGPENHFSVNTSVNPPAWSYEVNSSTYNGYAPNGSGKRWGTNEIADENGVLNESDSNLTGVIQTSRGDVISNVVLYDQGSSNPNEAQAVGGDSGSGVFYKRNGQWELVGIVHANLIYAGQSVPGVFNSANELAIYGNATAFADLASYRDQILAIMAANPDYSVAGDVNLDGLVTGDGTGSADTDDITAFVQGWRYDNGTGQGNMLSWSKGDLNHDGKVNASDFFKLRQAFGATGSSATSFNAIATAMLGIAAPEPSTAALLLLAAGSFLATARRRR